VSLSMSAYAITCEAGVRDFDGAIGSETVVGSRSLTSTENFSGRGINIQTEETSTSVYYLPGKGGKMELVRGTGRFFATVAAIAVLSMCSSTQAFGNIIQDGGFESATQALYATGPIGDGWYVTEGNIPIRPTGEIPHSGSQFADLDYSDTLNGLSQTIATNPGDDYQISFWLSDAGGGNQFDVSFGGLTLLSESTPNTGIGNYQFLTFDAPASGASAALLFTGLWISQPGVGTVIDDVSVTDLGPAGVPEPATWLMILGGCAAIGTARLRRRLQRSGRR